MWNPLDDLSDDQRRQLAAFEEQLLHLNRRFNLVASSTEPAVRTLHTLHSLTLSYRSFPPGTTVVDWGAGGGLPTLPLAICFPNVSFVAVDAVGKKTQAVRTVARRLGLTNVEAWHGRAERWSGAAAYSVSRATAPLRELWTWHARVARPPTSAPSADAWAPGLLCLKGGELTAELRELSDGFPDVHVATLALPELTGEAAFRDKVIVHIQAWNVTR